MLFVLELIAMRTMKPARILPLLLLTLALIAPRMASAQKVDTLFYSPDCGSDPGWDFGFLNEHPEFVNEIVLTLNPVDSIGFAGAQITEGNIGIWDYSIDSLGDSLVFSPLNAGGIGTGINDTGFYFLLGGLAGNQFPFDLFDHPVSIHWETLAGGTFVDQGTIILLPTIFQGNCTFDSVSASGTTVGCDPQFNFRVFNHNGPTEPINELKFELQDISAGSIRPSGLQVPTGWTVDSVTEFDAYFSTPCSGGNQINYGSNMAGFIIPIRANSSVTEFSWVWTASSCGDLIDRDTVLNVAATPQPCSENTNPDSLIIINTGECNFQINVKDCHNGNGTDTVSPLSSYTLTILTPGVTWEQPIVLPPQAISGTWQYSLSGNTLNFHELSKYILYGQPGGTIWTPRASIDDPNLDANVVVEWSDSNGTTEISSGIDTISCSSSAPDTAWVVLGADCNYTLIVGNTHTHPTSSIDAIAMTIPVSAGSFTASCFSSSNGWNPSILQQSARFTNDSGAKGYLRTGSYDTIHFCIDPAHPDSSWNLTWTTIDSINENLYFNTIIVPGCSPPLVCDSIHHSLSSTCSDTIIVLNRRQGGAIIDSIVITPMGGWKIDTALASIPWLTTIDAGKDSAMFSGGTIGQASSKGFIVSYDAGATGSFDVLVTTYSNGAACMNIQSLICTSSGVSPSSMPQTLSVSVVPNPMNQQADITLTTGAFDRVQMTLLDVLGRTSKNVMNSTIAAGDHDYTLDVSQLPPGTYYLRIEASGATLTKKLVIEH
jgi:Secretion system C-terminal sorting domain